MCCSGTKTMCSAICPTPLLCSGMAAMACCGPLGPCAGVCSKWADMYGTFFLHLQRGAAGLAAGRTQLHGTLRNVLVQGRSCVLGPVERK